MPKKEVPINHLESYLPANTYDAVISYLKQFKVHLTIARERTSILGDYRHKNTSNNHRISINGNLNKYSFFITLLHELAHLIAFEQFGHTIQAHGVEWKRVYGQLLSQFVIKKIFPADIEDSLLQSINNPGASTCAEEDLQRILYQYDNKKKHYFLLESLPLGTIFKTDKGRSFKKGKKRTKRFECTEIKTNKIYLFSAIYEVYANTSELRDYSTIN